MGIRAAQPLQFSPRGLTDAFDEVDSFPGACRALSNLIFDSANPDQVIARPGVGLPITSFATFNAPGFISIQETVGDITFGMIASSRNPGFEEPFAFNNVSGTFITISGVTAGNVPANAPSTGAWTPPTMTSIAKKIIITHPGFSGAGANFFGVLDVTNLNAPTWTSANTTTNALPSVPTSVANFNNRAYYVCGNQMYGSDSLSPLVITNLNSTVTVGDYTAITAQSGLPMQTVSSGVTATLVVFKANSVWILTGDTVSSNLTLSFVSLNVGCPHPRSVAQTPIGTIFISQDAPYNLLPSGILIELKNPSNLASDVRIPFQNSPMPSRTAAAFAGSIYRVCVNTVIDGIVQTNDYWFDLRRLRWTGPHTFQYDCASQYNGLFILSGVGTGAALFNSIFGNTTQNTVYNDNGVAIGVTVTTTNLHDSDTMEFKQVVESTIDVTSSGQSVSFSITANDDLGAVLASASVATPSASAVWGAFNWGDGTAYSTANTHPRRYDVAWNVPIVWDRMSLTITTGSANGVAIGKFKAKYQRCGYTLRAPLLPGVIPTPASPQAGKQLDVNFVLDQSPLS